MKKKFMAVCLLFSICLFFGCSGSKNLSSAPEGKIPKWYSKPPKNENIFYAANTAVSRDMQISFDKALTGARAEIGRQVEIRIQDMQKRFDEEVGVGSDSQILQQFTQASKNIVSTSLTGCKVKEKKQFKNRDLWRTYVMVEYPVGSANQALMDKIKNHELMYTRFRSSQAFKELEKDIQKYEEWKKQQGQF
jgi:hypothetical protein